MSIARGAVFLVVFALHGSFARAADPSWSGTVTLERSFDHTERRVGDREGQVSCTGSEQVRNAYRATATLHPGAAEATAEISASALMETNEACSGRIGCGGTLLQPEPSRPYLRTTRHSIQSSGGGGAGRAGADRGVRSGLPPVPGRRRILDHRLLCLARTREQVFTETQLV